MRTDAGAARRDPVALGDGVRRAAPRSSCPPSDPPPFHGEESWGRSSTAAGRPPSPPSGGGARPEASADDSRGLRGPGQPSASPRLVPRPPPGPAPARPAERASLTQGSDPDLGHAAGRAPRPRSLCPHRARRTTAAGPRPAATYRAGAAPTAPASGAPAGNAGPRVEPPIGQPATNPGRQGGGRGRGSESPGSGGGRTGERRRYR